LQANTAIVEPSGLADNMSDVIHSIMADKYVLLINSASAGMKGSSGKEEDGKFLIPH
jgi:hypothetical protein